MTQYDTEPTKKYALADALALNAKHGWYLFPLRHGERASHKKAELSDGRKWGMTNDSDEICHDFERWPLAGVGIPTGTVNGIVVLDFESVAGHGVDGLAAREELQRKYGPLPATLQAVTATGGLHDYFKCSEGIVISTSTSQLASGVDVIGENSMVVGPPTIRPGRGVYRWLNEEPIAELPKRWVAALVIAGRNRGKIGDHVDGDDAVTETAIVAAAMAVIPNNPFASVPDIESWEFGWDEWNRIGMAIFRATGGTEEGFAIFDMWSQKNVDMYNTKRTYNKWEKYRTSPPHQISYGSIRWLANKADPDWELRYDNEQATKQREAVRNARAKRQAQQQDDQQQDDQQDDQQQDDQPENEATAPTFSEDAIAFQFTIEHADTLRYVSMWNKWMIWNKKCWHVDNTRLVFSLARDMCRVVAEACTARSERKRIASAKTRAAVVSLAGDDRLHAGNTDQWDANPWLLNTPDGIIDLRKGKMRSHKAEDYITCMTAIAPDGDCDLWHAFLEKITAGDKELQNYLQRVCGYALTGLTIEHALFFLYGLGANGKGTFINAIAGILQDYHRSTPIETFTATNVDRHPTELADLRGARLVTATETEEGRRWAESRIKMLTGGDRVKARFMRQDFFEYIPHFKLMIAGNHKPGLRSVDEAIKRRFNLIPFTVTIPEQERDKDLGEKLRHEWPGILAWMIEGCLIWQRCGLAPPTIVTDATANYFAEEDTFEIWIDECCTRATNEWTSIGELFNCWQQWTQARGEYTGNTKRFSQRLAEKFEFIRMHGGRGFVGLTIYKNDPATSQKKRIWEPSM